MSQFACRVCGTECPMCPADEPAVCPEHCDDHEYEYEPEFRWHHCKHCDKPVDPDFYDDSDLGEF